VIAGEVKTNGDEFSKKQLERDFALSKKLQADMHVMAWVGELPSQALSAAKSLAEHYGLNLQLLDLDQLRN
jgi:hypothetical protein